MRRALPGTAKHVHWRGVSSLHRRAVPAAMLLLLELLSQLLLLLACVISDLTLSPSSSCFIDGADVQHCTARRRGLGGISDSEKSFVGGGACGAHERVSMWSCPSTVQCALGHVGWQLQVQGKDAGYSYLQLLIRQYDSL